MTLNQRSSVLSFADNGPAFSLLCVMSADSLEVSLGTFIPQQFPREVHSLYYVYTQIHEVCK